VKRPLALFAPVLFALSTSFGVNAQPVGERVRTESALDQLRKAEQRLAELMETQAPTAENSLSPQPADLRGKLQPLVEESFQARQRLQKAELAELRRRLEEIEKAIAEREKNKEAIISSRLDQLLSSQGKPVVHYVYEEVTDKDGKQVRIPVFDTRANPQGNQDNRPVISQQGIGFNDPRVTSPDDGFDIETRERLAEVELRQAKAKCDVAKYDYEAHRDANQKAPGSTPNAEMKTLELKWQVAQTEVEKAEVMLEGILKQKAADPSAGKGKGRQPRNAELIDKESRAPASDDRFDLETRERLAKLDVQDAEAEVAGAAEELAQAQKLQKDHAISANEVHNYERKHRHAFNELERAKLRLAAIGKQRASDPFADNDQRRPLRDAELLTGGSRNATSDDGLDLDTQERLTQLDLQSAEEGLTAAETKLEVVRALHQVARANGGELADAENNARQAAIEVKRAKLKIDGLTKQRAELEAAAEVSVAEAEAEVQKARANIRAEEAAGENFVAESKKAQADAAAAEASYEYRQKEYARVKALADAKSIEAKLVDEAEERLQAAKRSLISAQEIAKQKASNVGAERFGHEANLAALRIAEARLRAAQLRRDRFIHREAVDHKGDQPPPANANKNDQPAKTE
jgi:hypothetical protein